MSSLKICVEIRKKIKWTNKETEEISNFRLELGSGGANLHFISVIY